MSARQFAPVVTASPSQWISNFEAVATSGTTVDCRWKIDVQNLQQIQEMRIFIQPEYNAKATFTDTIDTTTTQYTLSDLTANTRYKVCLRIVTLPELRDARSCVDISTSFGFMPAVIGSVVGLLAAFVILACIFALSKYMQSRGIGVFRTPVKTGEKQSPEAKSLLSKKDKSPQSQSQQNVTASNPSAVRTPNKIVVRPEHLVEEIYCGEEDDSQTKKKAEEKPPLSAANDSTNVVEQPQPQALQQANSTTTATPTEPKPLNVESDDARLTPPACGNANGNVTHSSPNGNLIVTEALVTPECMRENALLSQSSASDPVVTTVITDNEHQSAPNGKQLKDDGNESTQSEGSGKREQLDNEKNESICKVSALTTTNIAKTETDLKTDLSLSHPMPQSIAVPICEDQKVNGQIADQLTPAEALNATNHVDRNEFLKNPAGAYTAIQMTEVVPTTNGKLFNNNSSVLSRPPAGIYMQFVETL